MNPMPALAPMLKRLRLSGLLHTLDDRNSEAIDRKLAYTDFLALLVQDEVARRDQKKYDLRVRAGFRSSKTLIAERYERAATVVTSNLDLSEWGDAFPNRLLGAATLDRLRHNAYRVVLEGDSYRQPKPMPGPSTAATSSGRRRSGSRADAGAGAGSQ